MAPPPRDFCVLGHPIAGDNIYLTKDGYKKCRECRKLASQRTEQRRLAKMRAARAVETDQEREARLAALKRSPEEIARYNANRRKAAARKRKERERERRAAARPSREQEQVERAVALYPDILKVDAREWLRDEEVFIKVMRDIIRVSLMEPGRLGPRPNPAPEQARAEWDRIVAASRTRQRRAGWD